ncbi:terpenoid synthase [Rhizopus microsporus var. microsporus]|uniref:Solanesyl pyrophosphate synthase n=2 Tax=Rhizopus microsporus TaxID=58291 RepID=A0A2G4TA18_RHIZD|nr:solanesyl pyrophosphate synthase [Rhizopus microsporus ATCC 52813]ORE10273.1 terpenoid synthase [Rhizopus microsporus var. microsporus]PHZ17843.1 solanesyl pyrophosphate synthase [Rhizopus microsporus ATCC 52813]
MHKLVVATKSKFRTTHFIRAVGFHSSRHNFVSTKEQPDISPLGKISSSINSIKNSILETTPLKQLVEEETPFTGHPENWSQAIREAQSLVGETDKERAIDPTKLVGRDLGEIKSNIAKLLYSGHPFLNRVAKHYFSGEGKHVRPLLVLLIAQATSIAEKKPSKQNTDYISIDMPISHGLQNIISNGVFDKHVHYTPSVTDQGCTILPTQRRLAEISEMIHTASLLHDDVIDASMTRRNLPSANASFGNKMAVLGGDFLLARASVALARLRNAECIELMSTCIANLVEGEFMQLRNTKDEQGTDKVKKLSTFDHYMKKTYMKTGSLIALSCKSSAVLGNVTDEVANVAFDFGKNLGLAFQLVDDMLDFTVTAAELGKPAGADLKLGLATAPVLFAWEEYPELEPLIKRKFSEKGDEERARDLVYKSDGLKKTLDLATLHCGYAIDALNKLPSSDARSALIQITEKLLTRKS